MTGRWWTARVYVAGEWCEFGSTRRITDAIAIAVTAWDELASHSCRPFYGAGGAR